MFSQPCPPQWVIPELLSAEATPEIPRLHFTRPQLSTRQHWRRHSLELHFSCTHFQIIPGHVMIITESQLFALAAFKCSSSITSFEFLKVTLGLAAGSSEHGSICRDGATFALEYLWLCEGNSVANPSFDPSCNRCLYISLRRFSSNPPRELYADPASSFISLFQSSHLHPDRRFLQKQHT